MKDKQQGRDQNRGVREFGVLRGGSGSLGNQGYAAHQKGRSVSFIFVTKLPRIFPFFPNLFKQRQLSACSKNPSPHPCLYKKNNISKPSYLFLTIGNVSDSTPLKGLIWREPVINAVDVDTFGINSKQEVCVVFILLKNKRYQ